MSSLIRRGKLLASEGDVCLEEIGSSSLPDYRGLTSSIERWGIWATAWRNINHRGIEASLVGPQWPQAADARHRGISSLSREILIRQIPSSDYVSHTKDIKNAVIQSANLNDTIHTKYFVISAVACFLHFNMSVLVHCLLERDVCCQYFVPGVSHQTLHVFTLRSQRLSWKGTLQSCHIYQGSVFSYWVGFSLVILSRDKTYHI